MFIFFFVVLSFKFSSVVVIDVTYIYQICEVNLIPLIFWPISSFWVYIRRMFLGWHVYFWFILFSSYYPFPYRTIVVSLRTTLFILKSGFTLLEPSTVKVGILFTFFLICSWKNIGGFSNSTVSFDGGTLDTFYYLGLSDSTLDRSRLRWLRFLDRLCTLILQST